MFLFQLSFTFPNFIPSFETSVDPDQLTSDEKISVIRRCVIKGLYCIYHHPSTNFEFHDNGTSTVRLLVNSMKGPKTVVMGITVYDIFHLRESWRLLSEMIF